LAVCFIKAEQGYHLFAGSSDPEVLDLLDQRYAILGTEPAEGEDVAVEGSSDYEQWPSEVASDIWTM
jgi:hypothetical protein